MDHLHSLDPSVGGSGPHGLTVRTCAHRLRAAASIASRTTCRDDRETPSVVSAGRRELEHCFAFSEIAMICDRLTRRAEISTTCRKRHTSLVPGAMQRLKRVYARLRRAMALLRRTGTH